jgi:hypothetical protein
MKSGKPEYQKVTTELTIVTLILQYCHLAVSTLAYILLMQLITLTEPKHLMLLSLLSYGMC